MSLLPALLRILLPTLLPTLFISPNFILYLILFFLSSFNCGGFIFFSLISFDNNKLLLTILMLSLLYIFFKFILLFNLFFFCELKTGSLFSKIGLLINLLFLFFLLSLFAEGFVDITGLLYFEFVVILVLLSFPEVI